MSEVLWKPFVYLCHVCCVEYIWYKAVGKGFNARDFGRTSKYVLFCTILCPRKRSDEFGSISLMTIWLVGKTKHLESSSISKQKA